MAELKDTHTGTSPVISRALKIYLDSLEGVVFNIQKCFAPAYYPPKKENGEYYQLFHIDASDKIWVASTAFQFQQEQPAEDSDPVPKGFMDTLLPNKSEYCVEEKKQVQEKKHEIEEVKSHKEKVIALKVQPQSRAVLLEKISTLEAGTQQLTQKERERSSNLEDELKLKCQSLEEARRSERVWQLMYQSCEEARRSERVWQLMYQSCESKYNELHENYNKMLNDYTNMLSDYTNMKSICESFMDSQHRAVIKAPKSYQPLRCEVLLAGLQCIQEGERYTDTDIVLCSEHSQLLTYM